VLQFMLAEDVMSLCKRCATMFHESPSALELVAA
jgi:hypothetical protein